MVFVQHVSKLYPLYQRPSDRLREILSFGGKRHTDFWALRNVSFQVEKGEVLSLVGPNGSGKSTMLQIVAGILQPTSGRVVTEGRVAALLELGAGFNPEFTGRENVFLNGEIMGLSRREVADVFPQIEAFAAIGTFIDRPVKEYSTGMYIRLAFSTAIHVDPDVLIVDEALAVGDAIFANRCIQKFEELKKRGVTVIFVSHDLGLVKRLSDRAIFLLNGEMVAEGSPNDVVNRYVGYVLERQDAPTSDDDRATPRGSYRHGDGTSRIENVEILTAAGQPSKQFSSGEPMKIRVTARFQHDTESPVIGILIRNRLGIDVYGTNTRIEQIDFGSIHAGEAIEIDFTVHCHLTRQEYTLTVATQHGDGSSQDWLDDALQFSVMEPKDLAGLVNLRPEIAWRRRPAHHPEFA